MRKRSFAACRWAKRPTGPLTVAINNYVGEDSIDWGHLFAGDVIATIPVIILFALLEARVVSGLTAGSIKQAT